MQNFIAINPIEQTLFDAQHGRLPASALFAALYASKVFVLVNRDVGVDGEWTDETTLLVLNSPAGTSVIAAFTALERTEGWPERSQEFRHALHVDFRWLIEGITDEVGLVLNPGSPVGLELAPEMIVKLQQSLAAG